MTASIFVACLIVEGTLSLSELGVLDAFRLRLFAIEQAGFWPGLLRDWTPNYPTQPALMFLTYGFLHAGVVHFAVNMFTLFSLGRTCARRIGEWRYALLYIASILGGAIGFAALASTLQPMVGASGALFGMVGAIVAWELVDLRREGRSLLPVARLVAILVLLNLVLWWAMDGQLAWQTHLGGFVAGFGLGLFLDPPTEDID